MALISGETTRFPNGISTDDQGCILGDSLLPDPTKMHTYFEDFDTYTAADWTVTKVGAATEALADEDGGVLLVTNDVNDDDSSFSQKVGESFLFESEKKAYFKARFKVSDAIQSDLIVGLQITDTTPLDVTDGVFFASSDESSALTLEVEKDDVSTSTQVATLSDDTYITVGFFYDGEGNISVYSDNVKVGNSVVTNLPDDEVLTVSFGIQNGEAASKTLSVDYIFVAKER
jgi:hypothetical protein